MKARHPGFTLLELLVTVGIMSMLGIAATGGYNALVRGMNERGVAAVAASALRSAKERARVDRRHVAVFCYNRLLRKENAAKNEPGIVAGTICAVKRVGRLSAVSGDYLYDEFADLDLTHGKEESQGDLAKYKGFRLYKFNNAQISRMEYSIVADVAYLDTDAQLYLPSLGRTTNAWMSAFFNLKQSNSEPSGGWKAGDGYGMEFLEVQLPNGFIFGRNVPSEVGKINVEKVIDFDPERDQTEQVEIYSTKPDASGAPKAWKPVETVKSDNSAV